MSKFTYVLCYNPNATNFSLAQVSAFVQNNKHIQSWYLAFSGTFLVKTDASLQELHPGFRQFFDGTYFIISYAIPSLMSGMLPQSAWDWVNTGTVLAIENK